MAADTRPFKSKEQDGQGNEVIIRDQQLVEQASQTTMASGEYFEIVDVDGRMAKIPKDNMIGVVREALGTLLNGLADQTTVTKALTLNGDTLGASTAATLASVLGVSSKIPVVPVTIENSMDITNYADSVAVGIYYAKKASGEWYMIAKASSSSVTIFLINAYSDTFGIQFNHRHNTSWIGWKTLQYT